MQFDPSGAAGQWWRAVSGRSAYVHVVLVGPRKSGKTTWFRQLGAADPDHVKVWNVVASARATSAEAVWGELLALLGLPDAPCGIEPTERLCDFLDRMDNNVTLVVDGWDRAVDTRSVGGRPAVVSDACYEVLDAIARFCIEQGATRYDQPCLGLVLVTDVPSIDDLGHFAHAVQRPLFERLSMLITRSFQAERFPMLTRAESEDVLRELGVPADDAPAAAVACGGWLWLLQTAAEVAQDGWGPAARAVTCNQRLPALLDETVLRWLKARPEVALHLRDPLDYLAQQLSAGAAPTGFGLPAAFDDETQPAPLISELLSRTFVIVDTENLRMPFQRHAEVSAAGYPEGVDAFLQRHVGRWIARLRVQYRVAAEDIWLVGRDAGRIDDTVGAATPGERLHPPREMQAKVRRRASKGGDSTDDALLIARVAQRVERYPLGRFIVVAEDTDGPLLLDALGSLHRVIVCTPWRASDKIREKVPPERLSEFGLSVKRPPHVTDEQLKAARDARRAGSQPAPAPQ